MWDLASPTSSILFECYHLLGVPICIKTSANRPLDRPDLEKYSSPPSRGETQLLLYDPIKWKKTAKRSIWDWHMCSTETGKYIATVWNLEQPYLLQQYLLHHKTMLKFVRSWIIRMAVDGNNKWTFPEPVPASDFIAFTAFSNAAVDFSNVVVALTNALVQEGLEADLARISTIHCFSRRFSCAICTFLFWFLIFISSHVSWLWWAMTNKMKFK